MIKFQQVLHQLLLIPLSKSIHLMWAYSWKLLCDVRCQPTGFFVSEAWTLVDFWDMLNLKKWHLCECLVSFLKWLPRQNHYAREICIKFLCRTPVSKFKYVSSGVHIRVNNSKYSSLARILTWTSRSGIPHFDLFPGQRLQTTFSSILLRTLGNLREGSGRGEENMFSNRLPQLR